MAGYRSDEAWRPAFKTGQIFFGHPQECCDCLIWELRTSGARIEVRPEAVPPRTVRLVSIALMLMIVTAVVPTKLLFSIFSGLTTGLSADKLEPFMNGMRSALWVLVAFSILGAIVSGLRGRHVKAAE